MMQENLLGESPKQAESQIKELKDLLQIDLQVELFLLLFRNLDLRKEEDKFPVLTDRHNVIVMCDEAHRTQYGFKGVIDQKTGQMKYGLARALRDGLCLMQHLLHLQELLFSR
jgi:type I restriction enzyme R subunit